MDQMGLKYLHYLFSFGIIMMSDMGKWQIFLHNNFPLRGLMSNRN